MSEVPLEISSPDRSDERDGNERPALDNISSQLHEKISPVVQLFSDFAETGDDPAIFLERLLDQIKTVMGADLLLLFGWNEGKKEWPLLYHHRLPERFIKDGVVPRAWQSLPSIVLAEGETLFSDNIAKDRRFVGQVIRGMNFATFLGQTLRSDETLLGSLSICYETPEALSPIDQQAFGLMANLLIPVLPKLPRDQKDRDPKPQQPKSEIPRPERSKGERRRANHTRPESPKLESPKLESPKPESPKLENPKPESPSPERLIPEIPKPENPKPENTKLQNPKSESPKPESLKPEGLRLSLDLSGRVLSCHPSLAELLGHTPERIQKKPFSRFLTRASRGKYSDALKTLKADPETNLLPFKLEIAKHGGRRRVLLVSLTPIKKEDQVAGIELNAENVTDTEPLEKELLNKDVVLAILNSIFTALDHFDPEEHALKTAFDKVFPLFGIEAGMVLQLDDKRQKLRLVAHHGLQSDHLVQIEKAGFDRKEHILWKVVDDKTSVLLLPEPQSSCLEKRQVGEDKLLSYMAVPLESSNQLWGVLCFFSPTRIFTGSDLKFLEAMGKDIGFAVDQMRLFQSLHKRIDALKTLNDAGKSLSSSLHLEQVFSSTVNSLRKMIGVSHGYIFMSDDKRHYLTGVAASGQLGNVVRKVEFKLNEDSLVPLTARERHPIIVENASRDATIGKKWMKSFKSRSLLSVPLISKERVLGVLVLDEGRYFRKFSDEEVEKVVGLAAQVSLAIDNAVRYNAVSRHRERLQTLSSAIVNIQEEEHRRIAKKLRNEAGVALSAIQKDLAWVSEALGEAAGSAAPAIQKRIEKIQAQAGETFENLRAISHDLRPAILDDSGLLATLKWYIKEFETQHKTKVKLQTNGSTKRFPARIEILLFRIIQEAMANIADHSHAESAVVSLEKREPYAHLYITDDGRGFDVKQYFSSPQVIRKGIGILGMKERIELAGGTFFIDSNPGNGTRISIRVPVVKRGTA